MHLVQYCIVWRQKVFPQNRQKDEAQTKNNISKEDENVGWLNFFQWSRSRTKQFQPTYLPPAKKRRNSLLDPVTGIQNAMYVMSHASDHIGTPDAL